MNDDEVGGFESVRDLRVMATSTWETPTDDEMAAIIAAIEVTWPKGTPEPAAGKERSHSHWRFSGRWWSKPLPLRRDRP